MTDQNQAGSKNQAQQKNQLKVTTAVPATEQTGAQADLTQLPAKPFSVEPTASQAVLQALLHGPTGAFGSGSTENQAARLSDPRLQTVQRQDLAIQIGQTQGNQHLQRVAETLQLNKPSQFRVVQRALTFDDAKKKIEEASSGWGTDESAIYAAIRDCSDRAKLKADPDVQRWLKEELSGHDLWKAQLLLEYGNESAFPPALQEIWTATTGWGTDEQRIYKALQGLSAADIAIISAIPGLKDMLKEELSGKDLAATNDLLSGDYAKQIAAQKANVAFVKAELTNMKAPANPPEIRNTAEWLDPTTPGVQPKNELYVLTPTHDAAARAKAHGKDPDVAYFGDSPKFPDDTADYDAHIDSKRNIHYSAATVVGEHLESKIWVHDPKNRGATAFRETVVHEVQHDADRHDKEEGYDQSYKSAEESWNRYKTEFRAYWIDGERSSLSTAPGSAPAPWDNARQKNIFDHMYGASPTDVYAEWLRPNYDNNTEVYGQKFQDLVHGYTKPEGVNLINSPRIDDFFLQLEKCEPGQTDLTTSPLKELETAAKALDADDQAYINSTVAKRLQEMMKDHLASLVLTHIATIVNGGTAPAWITVNIAGARRAITEAGEGWGTDEQKIYDTIAAASPAERAEMKTDPTIRRILHEELSGHDLWKAQLLVEFGPEAQWPQTITDLWQATIGAGTDEALIRTALQKLTRPQVEAIARVEGLRAILDDELSGQDKTTTDELLGGQYADAMTNHQQDMVTITSLIQAGLTDPDPKWQTTCTKLNDPAKALIHAMTRTHNSAARIKEAKQTGKEAYFGTDTAYPSTNGGYDSLPTNNNGIRLVAPGTKSETLGRNLYIYEARTIPADLRIILETFGQTLT